MEEKENTLNVEQPIPSDEEKSWVKSLSTGRSNEAAAEEFGLNKNNFAYKISKLRERYNCKNTAELISYFFRNGLID